MEDAEMAAAPPERPERRDARENRRLLLEVAKRLFAQQGVPATSMKEIAEAAGVGKGTLYRNFAHKGELCVALLREDVAAFQEHLDPLISDAGRGTSPLTRLDILMTERVHMTERHLPLFAAIDEEAGGSGRARPSRTPFAAWTHAHIVRLLGAAVARGEAPPVDLEFTADAIEAVMSPQHYRFQRHAAGYSMERIIAGLRRLFVDGLRQGPPT
ncbi:MAG: TetR/AcrR family transcriptional regulator [Chloroflexota bacterium]|nr:TetR/AcrR family transcriptional regulator [Chloroflexota bacterium]